MNMRRIWKYIADNYSSLYFAFEKNQMDNREARQKLAAVHRGTGEIASMG